eukprot:jgi/Phyca11/559221/estExt2_Genewise1.C_PHYCAscaffold_30164
MWQAQRLLHQQTGRSHYESVSDLLIRIVLRKRVKSEQTVVVWRAHTLGEGDFRDIQSEEVGWSVVRPTDTNTRNAVGMPTAILTFVRFIPTIGGSKSMDMTKVGQFMRLAESSGNEQGSEVTRMMESLLLDDS